MISETSPALPMAAGRPGETPVELYEEHDPIVLVPDPYDPNRSVAVRRSALTLGVQLPPREPAPQPRIDPWAQRAVGLGVGAGAAGWGGGHLLAGAGQLVSAATSAGSVAGALALLLLVAKLAPSERGSRGKTVNVTTHNHFGGRSSVNVR
ncbi:hypothetical protein [Streptomyces longwoodensis]|uniref:hypothetical protein n=1 Tax=Streptomyces longwoodensis TaxID=68231 RepID=UPI00384C6AC0